MESVETVKDWIAQNGWDVLRDGNGALRQDIYDGLGRKTVNVFDRVLRAVDNEQGKALMRLLNASGVAELTAPIIVDYVKDGTEANFKVATDALRPLFAANAYPQKAVIQKRGVFHDTFARKFRDVNGERVVALRTVLRAIDHEKYEPFFKDTPDGKTRFSAE